MESGSPAPPLSRDPEAQTLPSLDPVLQRHKTLTNPQPPTPRQVPSSLGTPFHNSPPAWDPDPQGSSSSSTHPSWDPGSHRTSLVQGLPPNVFSSGPSPHPSNLGPSPPMPRPDKTPVPTAGRSPGFSVHTPATQYFSRPAFLATLLPRCRRKPVPWCCSRLRPLPPVSSSLEFSRCPRVSGFSWVSSKSQRTSS